MLGSNFEPLANARVWISSDLIFLAHQKTHFWYEF